VHTSPDVRELREIRSFLPLDYRDLTVEGKRKARIAICSDHRNASTFVKAWKFFRQVYLLGSGIFYDKYVPSPPYHAGMVHDYFAFQHNLCAAPRGGGKSTVIAEEVPLLVMITKPKSVFAICTATQVLVEDRIDHLMEQLTENQLIYDDFGNLRPPRGGGMWSKKNLRLTNGSRIRGFPVDGRKRGARPHTFILDDPEYDPKNEVSVKYLRAHFDTMLAKQIFPMLREGCRLFWIGTVLNSSSYIHHALTTKEDKRFHLWNQRLVSAEVSDASGNIQSVWPEMMSKEYLNHQKLMMGPAAYASEYLNKPLATGARLLVLDEDLDTYTVQGDYLTNPWDSQATLISQRVDMKTGAAESQRTPFSEFLKNLYLVIVVDYASTLAAYSDYSVVHVMGFDRDDTLWSLDLWMGKVRSETLVNQIFKMGSIWHPRIIGVEAVSIQKEIFERVLARFADVPGSGWQPRVFPIRYPRGVSKAERIESIAWRFSTHRIKYPRHLKTPAYRTLYEQTENFTPDLALLEHDDCLDTIAMTPYLLRGTGSATRRHVEILSRLRPRESGFSGLQALNASELTPNEINELLDRAYNRVYTETEDEMIRPLSETTVIG